MPALFATNVMLRVSCGLMTKFHVVMGHAEAWRQILDVVLVRAMTWTLSPCFTVNSVAPKLGRAALM